jgi:hypothetical protein
MGLERFRQFIFEGVVDFSLVLGCGNSQAGHPFFENVFTKIFDRFGLVPVDTH